MGVTDKTILITGAGSGIGQGLAFHSASDGFRVIATDMDENAARETADEINESGGQADAFRIDVTNESDIQRFQEIMKNPRIDVLINNAGLQYVSHLEEFPQEKWDLLIRVMLTGACMMSRRQARIAGILKGHRIGDRRRRYYDQHHLSVLYQNRAGR